MAIKPRSPSVGRPEPIRCRASGTQLPAAALRASRTGRGHWACRAGWENTATAGRRIMRASAEVVAVMVPARLSAVVARMPIHSERHPRQRFIRPMWTTSLSNRAHKGLCAQRNGQACRHQEARCLSRVWSCLNWRHQMACRGGSRQCRRGCCPRRP